MFTVLKKDWRLGVDPLRAVKEDNLVMGLFEDSTRLNPAAAPATLGQRYGRRRAPAVATIAALLCGGLVPCNVAGFCAALLAVKAAAPQAVYAQYDTDTPDASVAKDTGPTVDLDIMKANVLSVVRALRLQSGVEIVVVGNPKEYSSVTLTISGSLSKVLRYVAMSAGATITRNPDGVYVMRPAKDDSSAGSGDGSDGAPVQQAAWEPTAPKPTRVIGPMHWEKIVLQNVEPNFILNMLNDTEGLRDTDAFHTPIVKENFLPRPGTKEYLDNMISTPTPPIVDLDFSHARDMSSEQPSVPMSNGNSNGSQSDTANRSSMSGGNQAEQFPGGAPGGFGGQGGFGGAPGGFGAGGVNGNNANNPLNDLKPEGVDRVIANQEDNSLLVLGDQTGIATLKQIIQLLDVPPKQVEIKLEFISATLADINQFGMNFDLIPFPNVETGTQQGGQLTTGGTFLTYAEGNVATQLFAFLSTTHSKVISAPIVTSTNNTPASILVNQVIPYQTSTTVVAGSGTATTGQQTNFLNVPTGLQVVPRINGDNSVTLIINPILSTLSAPPPGSTLPPTVTSQTIQAIRTVANGETMVLGGLVSKQESQSTTRVPFLGDLPFLGNLFRTRNDNVDNTDLLIFVTPTVLPPINAENDLFPSGSTTGAATVGVTP